MAALAEPFSQLPQVAVRDLREFRAAALESVLRAEEEEWLRVLHWDFRNSSDLVRKFVDMGNLNGAVLVNSLGVIGYAYFVYEDGKGLLGDLYVVEQFRTSYNEHLLMSSVTDQIAATGGVPRVEGQIMMLSAPLEKPDRHWRGYEAFGRAFLARQLPGVAVERNILPGHLAMEPWNPAFQEQAAQLIPATYQKHVDSRINDQYRSVTGARKFLHNIVQFPGCGVFQLSASLAAFDRRSGFLCGVVLSSMVAEASGHITQVCVHPEYQGLGLGRELLRGALELFQSQGCRTVSLTVTIENRGARMLYERLGFRMVRKFGAYVWEP